MGYTPTPIATCVTKVSTWNPLRETDADDFPYVDLSSVNKETKSIALEDVPVVSPAEAPSRARQIIATGDVLVSTVRPNLNGVALVSDQFDGATASTGYSVLRPAPKKLDSKYLFYWVQTPQFIESMMKQATGANYPAVSDRVVKGSGIPLPPLAEQQRIAAILDKADALRRKRQQAIDLADQFLRSVFLDMFGDPVSNPKGWPVEKMDDLAACQLGKMLSQKAKSGDYPKKYLRNANVRWGHFDLDDLLEMDFSPKEQSKFSLENGDLLVCEGGDIGRCAIWKGQVEDCYFQKALHRVRVGEQILPEYLQEYFYWMSKLGGFSKSVSEVTFSHLTSEKLKKLDVPVPPMSLQKEFTRIVNRVSQWESKAFQATCEKNDLFSSLSQQAFSGQL